MLQAVYDKYYDFTEVLQRDPIPRPHGNILLVISLEPSFHRKVRLFFIENKSRYYCVGQLIANSFKGQNIQLLDLIKKYLTDSKVRTYPHILQIDDPFFNIEWHFEITKVFYNSMIEKLSNIHIPIKISDGGLDGTTRAIYLNGAYPIYIEWWTYEEQRWKELTLWTDEILSFGLTGINQAYRRKIY